MSIYIDDNPGMTFVQIPENVCYFDSYIKFKSGKLNQLHLAL